MAPSNTTVAVKYQVSKAMKVPFSLSHCNFIAYKVEPKINHRPQDMLIRDGYKYLSFIFKPSNAWDYLACFL